ncbi:MAG TPA: HNH endonuclease signature motif containing protein [Pyrinomonadaceae bacterium]|nr:HNH endonuclease signature motif containing protein [Pyrinomonadaceae bacterium]
MARWISADIRETIADRAQSLCEYCLISEADTFYGCEVDHIISLKHGGSSELDNLAYACAFCNRAKGSDVGSVSANSEFTRFFNPRTDRWAEHFRLEDAAIRPLTTVGEVTARILGFNDSARLHEREEMIRFAKYPSEAASVLMATRST